MKNFNFSNFYKNPNYILVLILGIFFFKGALLSAVFPIFGGQDESRHYNTIQYLAEPAEKTWELSESTAERDKDHLETYGFSAEIRHAAIVTDTAVLRGEIFNTINFSPDYAKINEAEIASMQHKPYNYNLNPEIVGGNFYHKITSFIEKTLHQQNILTRFYTLRIFSVLLGVLSILFFYLTVKTIGMSEKNSLLLTAIVAFQPKLAMYFSNINYDVFVIPAFFLFTLAGTLVLKKGLDWKNGLLLFASTFIAIQTKPTGLILLVILLSLFAYLLYGKIKTKNKNIQYLTYFICALIFVFLVLYLVKFLPGHNQPLAQSFGSIGKYLSKSISFGKFGLTERTYWGTLGWTDSWLLDHTVELLKYIEIIALVGLGLFFFGKKEKSKYLPEKKYIIFFIVMVIGLQLEIRIADWGIFNKLGRIELGTPGRYFLPNLASHIILMFTGLGMLFAYFKKEHYFEKSLIIGLLTMFALSMYLMFNVIIYRFYL